MKDKIEKVISQNIILIVFTGQKKSSDSEYSKVTIKPFLSKDDLKYQLEYTIQNKVIHKNIVNDMLASEICQLLSKDFTQCIVYGEENDAHINCFSEDKIKIKYSNATKKIANLEHNKKKQYILNEGEDIDFLIYLGVMTKDKKVVKAKYNKFRQINKYLELLKPTIDALSNDNSLKIVDFGCGKAYLTFALYYYIVKILNKKAYITGLDLKDDVIDFCNKVAQDLNYDDLEFKNGDIKNYNRTQDVDLVIMLHACDNATDEGIVQSLKFNARAIIAVPCCQHEFFNQISNKALKPILDYGIMKERFSAMLTDVIRAEILKALGFEVNIIEFIETEHTPKNIAIKAIRKSDFDNTAFVAYKKLKDEFKLKPYIEKRLIEEKILNNQ